MNNNKPTFIFNGEEHDVGDYECGPCWARPTPHDCDLPGCLEHTAFFDENYDGDVLVSHCGDLCGER